MGKMKIKSSNPILKLFQWGFKTMPIFCLLIWMAGCCTTIGNNLSPPPIVNDIKVGETSYNEIRQMFGSPWRVDIEEDQTIWTYGKFYDAAEGKMITIDLIITFGDSGKVISYSLQYNGALGWTAIGPIATINDDLH